MVAIVDELEERGLVERRPHPSDRRIRAVYLTPPGRKLLARGRRIAIEHEKDIRRGLSAAEGRRLVALLQKVVDAQEIGSGVHPGLSEEPPGRRVTKP
jgi:DNA-binding MarR family transcriptional regulator